MGKFERQDFKGDFTKLVLEKELQSLLNNYKPQTMMANEMDTFYASLSSLAIDYNRIRGCDFWKLFEKSVQYLKDRNPNFVEPVISHKDQ